MIIHQYLTRQVFVVTLTIAAILTAIILGTRVIQFLGDVVDGRLELGMLFTLIGLRVPVFFQYTLPLSLYLGILLVMSRMYADNEMTVLRANGISQFKLFSMLLGAISMIAISVAVITIWISPWGYNQSVTLQKQQRSRAAIEQVIPGTFYNSRLKNIDRVFFIDSVNQDRSEIQNVFIAENSRESNDAFSEKTDRKKSAKSAHVSTLFANTGKIEELDGERYLVLQDGYRYQGKPGAADYQVISFDQYETLLPSPKISFPKNKMEGISSETLWAQYQTNAKYGIELNWRISLIILCFIAAMLAVPMSRVRPRQGRFARLVPAIMLYLLYLSLLITVKNTSKNVVSSIAMFALIHLCFLGFALYILLPAFRYRVKFLVKNLLVPKRKGVA